MTHPKVERKLPQVVTPSKPRIDPKGKPIVQKNMLASFGIKPAQRKQFSSFRDTKLKCCIIETPIDNSIIFCFEPSNKKASSWSEKLFYDELKCGLDRINDMNFDEFCYNWYDKFVQQSNSKGYPIKLFCINIETASPPFDVLVSIGKHVCEHVNSYPDNKTTTLVDEKDFIWIKNPTWMEVIGLIAAQRRLEKEIGPFHENTYFQHPDTVHSFFKEQQLPLYLGRLIGAPDDQIEQDTCETSTHQDCKSDSDSDDCNQSNKTT